MKSRQRLQRAAADLSRLADGDLQLPELDNLRERLADSLVMLEYEVRPKPSRRQQLGFFAGVAGVAGAVATGVVLWRSRRRLPRLLRGGEQSVPPIVTGRGAMG